MEEIDPVAQDECNDKKETKDKISEEQDATEKSEQEEIKLAAQDNGQEAKGRTVQENIKITEVTTGSSIWSNLSILFFYVACLPFIKVLTE